MVVFRNFAKAPEKKKRQCETGTVSKFTVHSIAYNAYGAGCASLWNPEPFKESSVRRSISRSVQCPVYEHSVSTSVIILQHCMLTDSENQKSSCCWRFVKFFPPFPADSSCADQSVQLIRNVSGQLIGMISVTVCRQTT